MAAKIIDPDNPEWTKDDFARARPASEVLPAAAAALLTRKQGRPPLDEAARKVPVSIRLSPDVLEALRATGKGWQTRADEMLRAGLKLRTADRAVEAAARVAAETRARFLAGGFMQESPLMGDSLVTEFTDGMHLTNEALANHARAYEMVAGHVWHAGSDADILAASDLRHVGKGAVVMTVPTGKALSRSAATGRIVSKRRAKPSRKERA